jgi:uncharacterized membrane protein YphA (DoxX/SURF4 family)
MNGILFACRLLLAGIILVAGATKIRRVRAFAGAVARYELLPRALVAPLARVLPAVEIACGICLALGVAQRTAAAVTAGLLAAFAVAMAVNLLRGRRFPCGCHGPDSKRPIGWLSVCWESSLAGIAMLLTLTPTVSPALPQPFGPADPATLNVPELSVAVISLLAGLLAVRLLSTALRLQQAARRVSVLVDRLGR